MIVVTVTACHHWTRTGHRDTATPFVHGDVADFGVSQELSHRVCHSSPPAPRSLPSKHSGFADKRPPKRYQHMPKRTQTQIKHSQIIIILWCKHLEGVLCCERLEDVLWFGTTATCSLRRPVFSERCVDASSRRGCVASLPNQQSHPVLFRNRTNRIVSSRLATNRFATSRLADKPILLFRLAKTFRQTHRQNTTNASATHSRNIAKSSLYFYAKARITPLFVAGSAHGFGAPLVRRVEMLHHRRCRLLVLQLIQLSCLVLSLSQTNRLVPSLAAKPTAPSCLRTNRRFSPRLATKPDVSSRVVKTKPKPNHCRIIAIQNSAQT